MAETKSPNGDKPSYEKWATVSGAVVAVLSLLLNGFQAFSANRVDKKNKELELLLKEKEVRVDLEPRYLVIGAMTAIEPLTGADTARPVMRNSVWQQLQPWLEKWEVGEALAETGSGIKAHGVVFLRVANVGKQDARRVVLTVKQKDFRQDGQSGENLWELDTKGWSETEVRLADLPAGRSVLIPLAHMLGTTTYYGRLLMPVRLEWYNPTLQTKEPSLVVQTMAPEDQWISNGLNVSVAQ